MVGGDGDIDEIANHPEVEDNEQDNQDSHERGDVQQMIEPAAVRKELYIDYQREINRERVIQEIFSSEETYVRNLRTLLQAFVKPMEDEQHPILKNNIVAVINVNKKKISLVAVSRMRFIHISCLTKNIGIF
jgi:hypothetical protein